MSRPRRFREDFAAGDVVLYRHDWRGWDVGTIESIGKAFATIEGNRVHAPRIQRKLRDPADAKELIAALKAIDEAYRRAEKEAADARAEAKRELLDRLCEPEGSRLTATLPPP